MMKIKKKILFPGIVFILFLIILIPVSSLESTDSPGVIPEESNPSVWARSNYEKALELYKAGEYESCRTMVNAYIVEFEEQKIFYPNVIKGKVYLLKAILAYAFREQGYKEEIEKLFLKGIKIYTDLDIREDTTVSPFLIELFRKVKTEYLSQFSKAARRNTIGFVTSLIYTDDFDPGNIQPGLHYAFNLTNFLSITMDIKFPIPGNSGDRTSFWNYWRIKNGITWYPEFNVEDLIFGLGVSHILSLDDWQVTKNSISLCGHGEVFFRIGLGFGVDVEVLRFDINQIREDIDPLEGGSDRFLHLFFANIDVYALFAF